jgi:replication initiation protein RepC
MQTGSVTTPFGRRPMTLALMKRQMHAAEIKPGKSADKWKIFRDASAAMVKLGIQSNSLAVLDALLSFYPDSELREDAQLIVFPSNVQLSLRAHQMAGATVRRHIAALVNAGLILRRDSANGKRYARKDRAGEIETAFGFDLSPLLARCEELAIMAQQVMADRAAFRTAKESLTICRRDVRKLITAALDEGVDGDWRAIEENYVALVHRIPRAPSIDDLTILIGEMQKLRTDVVNRLDIKQNTENKSGNAAPVEQHIQNSKTESINELEPSFGQKQERKSKPDKSPGRKPQEALLLGTVLRACPAISDYGPGGTIGHWRDLMTAAVVVRSMLGVSPSGYQDACEVMGPENAAVAIACILERASFITSPGGYLRDLTRRAERGEFSLGPMIMALLRVSGERAKMAG